MFSPHVSLPPTYYYRTQPNRLQKAIDFARTRPPAEVRSQFMHMVSLLEQAWPNPSLHHLAIDLTAALYPWPKRWGFIWDWVAILTQAIEVSHAIGRLQDEAMFTSHLAELLRLIGSLSEAIRTAQKALLLAQQADLPQTAAWTIWILWQALTATNRTVEADTLLNTALTQLPLTNNPHESLTIQVILALARTRHCRNLGLLETCVEMWAPLWQAIQTTADFDPYLHAFAHGQYAFLLFNLTRHHEMVTHLQQAVVLLQQIGDELQADSMQGNLAFAYSFTGQLSTARLILHQLIRKMEHYRLQKEVAEWTSILAFVNLGSGHLSQALAQLQRSVELHQQIREERGMMLALMNQAHIRILTGQVEQGLAQSKICRAYYETATQPHLIAVCDTDICIAYCYLGEHEKGYALAQELLTRGQTELAPYRHITLFAHRCLALFLPPRLAEMHLHQALKIAQSICLPLQEAACLIALAGITAEPERTTLWQQGIHILRQIDALEWVNGRSPTNPPLISMDY